MHACVRACMRACVPALQAGVLALMHGRTGMAHARLMARFCSRFSPRLFAFERQWFSTLLAFEHGVSRGRLPLPVLWPRGQWRLRDGRLLRLSRVHRGGAFMFGTVIRRTGAGCPRYPETGIGMHTSWPSSSLEVCGRVPHRILAVVNNRAVVS